MSQSCYSGKSHKYNYDNGEQIAEGIITLFLDEQDLTSGVESRVTSAVHHLVPCVDAPSWIVTARIGKTPQNSASNQHLAKTTGFDYVCLCLF